MALRRTHRRGAEAKLECACQRAAEWGYAQTPMKSGGNARFLRIPGCQRVCLQRLEVGPPTVVVRYRSGKPSPGADVGES
jgi:hypothetical protein